MGIWKYLSTCAPMPMEVGGHFLRALVFYAESLTCTQRSPAVLSCFATVPMGSICPILDYNILRLQAYDFLQKCFGLNLDPHAVQKVLYRVSCFPSLKISFSNYQLTDKMKLL